MARQASGLGTLARIALGAGAAGFGWSAGRDAYKVVRKNLGIAIAVATCAGGAGYAAWDLSRGHQGGVGAFRVVRAVFVALASLAAASVALTAMAGHGNPGVGVVLALAIQAVSAIVGLVVGLVQRRRRAPAFALEAHNLAFLEATGIRDVGGNEDTYLDRDGNELKLKDVRRDAMVFSVHGRRNIRAYIDLDPAGRMTGYRQPA